MAVLINKAMIEIPPKFAGKPPVNPDARRDEIFKKDGRGAGAGRRRSLLRPVDARRGGEAHRPLYPKIDVTAEMAKSGRTSRSTSAKAHGDCVALGTHGEEPEPGLRKVDVPLASTFMLSTKAGKEAYVEPVIEGGGYHFTVKVGKPKDRRREERHQALGRSEFQCLMSGTDRSELH